jgi:hypothetical protein
MGTVEINLGSLTDSSFISDVRDRMARANTTLTRISEATEENQ